MQIPTVLLALLMVVGDAAKLAPRRGTDWWSLQPLQRPAVPIEDSAWVRTPVDAFIFAKLREKGLAPSQDADRHTLIRRLTYNLHGLPPTPQEVAEFVGDTRAGAYERLVDRLLESPRYGERWARHWLDVVHYGESHGYDKDKPRPNAWPYRDYVIQSLNSDKPFNLFAQEQIAGDVLYPDDPDAVIATGFIAAGPWDFVGHVELPETKTDGLIARYNDRDDMVSATMSTFVSLTVHCARCHDHKFDPISQQDYYRLQAVFAGVDRADRPFDRDRRIHARRRQLMSAKRRLDYEIGQIEQAMSKITSLEIRETDQKLGEVKAALSKISPAAGSSPSNGYHSAIMSDADHEKWVQVDLGRKLAIDTIRLVPARPTDFPDTPGFGFPLRYRVEVADDPTFHNASVVVDRTGADLGPQPDEAIVIPARGKAGRFVRVTATRLWMRTRDFVFALSELEVLSDGKNAALGCSVTALDSIEAGRWSTKYLVDGYASRRPVESIDPPGGDRKRLEADAAELSARRQQLVEQSLAPGELVRLQALRAELQELQRKLAELPKPSLVYSGTSDFGRQGHFAPAHEPLPVHLLLRGDVRQPGQLMSPGSVESIGALAATFDLPDGSDEGARRAALARWITDLRNPLTFRSIVNRVWQYHFGRGIVDTPNDFGRMGDEPTHPDLLDWLANWFIDQGQSLKALHRLIVTSSTYRQVAEEVEIKPYNSTFARRQALDADNRYLWRMNRIRLDAESIRDAALYAAGRLDCAMGGPSIQQFLFKDDHSPVYDYTQFKWGGSESGRRSIYRFIVRSVPDPFMDSLDCPDASQLVPKRNTTLTALQALSLLNNPFIVRHAELLAERVRREADGLAGQVGLACQLTLGRLPSSEESADLIAHANGYGLENVCRILLNSNEFMFID